MTSPQNMTLKLMTQAAVVSTSVSTCTRLHHLGDRSFLWFLVRFVYSAYFKFLFIFAAIKWGLYLYSQFEFTAVFQVKIVSSQRKTCSCKNKDNILYTSLISSRIVLDAYLFYIMIVNILTGYEIHFSHHWDKQFLTDFKAFLENNTVTGLTCKWLIFYFILL